MLHLTHLDGDESNPSRAILKRCSKNREVKKLEGKRVRRDNWPLSRSGIPKMGLNTCQF